MNILSADKMNAMCVAECAISRTHRLPANENRLHFYTTERIDASEIIGDSACQQAEFSCNRYSQLDSPFDGFGMEMKNLHRVYNKTECFYFKLSRIVQVAEEKKTCVNIEITIRRIGRECTISISIVFVHFVLFGVEKSSLS